jgi:hypothetical protein
MNTLQFIHQFVKPFEKLGTRLLRSGAVAIGQIDKEKFLHVVFPPITDEQVRKIDKKIGKLPGSLRLFLEETNGLDCFISNFALEGYRANYKRDFESILGQPYDILTSNVESRSIFVGEHIVFFGSYRYDGTLLGISRKTEVVYRINPETGKALNKWVTIDSLIRSELPRLGKIYEKHGNDMVDIFKNIKTTPKSEKGTIDIL